MRKAIGIITIFAIISFNICNANSRIDSKPHTNNIESSLASHSINQYNSYQSALIDFPAKQNIDSKASHSTIINPNQAPLASNTNAIIKPTKAPIIAYPNSTKALERAYLEAVSNGDLESLKHYVAQGVNIHTREGDSYGAITIAASKGNATMLQYLLSLGLSPDGEEGEAWSPLLQAKDFKSAEILLEAGANPNKSYFGTTPLEKYIEHLPYLLSKGVDIDIITDDGRSVVYMAAPHEEIFKLVERLKPIEQNREAYDNALFLHLRGDFPYTNFNNLSKEEQEKVLPTIQRLKNAGARIDNDMLNFTKGYNFSEAKIKILDFKIEGLEGSGITEDSCPFRDFSKEDILRYFKYAQVQNSVGDYQDLFSVFNCEIKGRLKAYNRVWDFAMTYDGRARFDKEEYQRDFRTYFICDAPKCKPCRIDQHGEYREYSNEELERLAKSTSCMARDELERRENE